MLPQNLTFPSDIWSSQILYAGFVGTYSRILISLIISLAMSKNREGAEKKWQVLNGAVKQKMRNVILMNENWKQNVHDTEHWSGKNKGGWKRSEWSIPNHILNQIRIEKRDTRETGYNSLGTMVHKYYEIMKSKCIFWDGKIVFSLQIKA